jgi:hypothetical protein
MPPYPRDEPHQIDDLEHRLYDPKHKQDDAVLHAYRDKSEKNLPTTWENEGSSPSIVLATTKEPGVSFGLKVFLLALLALFLALGFAAWQVFSSRNNVSTDNIDVVLDVASYIEGGESTPLTVSVLNRNTVSLQNAVLTLSYEKGVGIQNEQEKIYDKRTLGALASNALSKQEMNVVVYGAEGDIRDLTVKLEYQVVGANAIFNKVVTTSVVLKTPPVTVHIEGPTSLVQGQVATYTLEAKNNTSTTTQPALLTLSVPSSFSLITASPQSLTKGYIWNVPALAPGATSVTKITGSFTGTSGETNTLQASIGSVGRSANELGVVYSTEKQSVNMTAALLALSLRLETDRGAIDSLRYGDVATLTLSYENKSERALKDVSLVLHIEGDAPILASIASDSGYYDSISKTITFDKASINTFAVMPAGAKGSFTVRIPIVTKGNNSPALTLAFDGGATLTSQNDTTTKITKTWVVQGSATVNAVTLSQNSSFSNTGPLPPQANTTTTYAAHIIVSAQNTLSRAKVSFLLPGYVSWSGVYTKGADVQYDARTRKVTWNIGTVTGVGNVSGDIQVSVKPSQSHVGQTPAITSGITLEADETESQVHIRTTTDALTTTLKQDASSADLSRVVASQ